MKKNYFEGWYLKQQTREGKTLALIPGRAEDGAFLQVVTDNEAWNVPFPPREYHRANPAWLGPNRFSMAGVKLEVYTDTLHLAGRLRYHSPVPLHYSIMGPLAPLPLECRHTVRSMQHSVEGHLWLNGHKLDFTGGRGYMEGDSGTSFPDKYTWCQCNYFPRGTSVMMAAARIPVGPARVWGCTAVVLLEGRQYRIASYLGAHIAHRDEKSLCLKQGPYCLLVETQGARKSAHPLAAPMDGGMKRTIHENPAMPARFLFTRGGTVLLDTASPFASYEYVE